MSRKKDISLMRKTIVAGNWKMNKTPSEAKALIEELKPLVASETSDVVFCVPAIDIPAAIEAAAGSNIAIGAENMYFEESGAYTGEIAPNMLTDLGVKYVILGHSERREYFAETDETVNKKVLKAFEHGITPIVCCGETLAQREQGVTIDFVRQQIKIAFQGVSADQAKTAVIAYEQSGLLEQVKLQLQNRLRKFAQQSVHVSQKYMMKLQQKQSAFSMVDLYLQLVHQNYLHSQISTVD